MASNQSCYEDQDGGEEKHLSICQAGHTIPSGCEVLLEGDEAEGDLERRHGHCKKNPGHTSFIPVSDFTLEHLPEEHRSQETLDLIRRKMDMTVAVRVPYTSPRRPDTFHDCDDEYPAARYKSKTGLIRYGTGCVTNVTRLDEKCPCHLCRDSGDRKDGYWKINVSTATHVIFDDSEAKHAEFKCFFDSQDKKTVRVLYGLGLDGAYDPEKLYVTDFNRKVMCATHDQETAERLSGEFPGVMTPDLSNFVHATPALMISHPHGCSKRITLGSLLHLTIPVQYASPYLEEFTICHVSSGTAQVAQDQSIPPASKEAIPLDKAVNDILKTAIAATIPESEDINRFERIERVCENTSILNMGTYTETSPEVNILNVGTDTTMSQDDSIVKMEDMLELAKIFDQSRPEDDKTVTAGQNVNIPITQQDDKSINSNVKVSTENANIDESPEDGETVVNTQDNTPCNGNAIALDPEMDEDSDNSKNNTDTIASLNALLSSNNLEQDNTVVDIFDPRFGRAPIYNKPDMFVRAFEHAAMMALKPTSTTLEPGSQIMLPPYTTYKLPMDAPYAMRYFKEGDGRFIFPAGTTLISPEGEEILIPDGAEFDNPLYSPHHFDVSYSIDTCPACSGAPVYCDLADGEYFLTHYGCKQMKNKSGVHSSCADPTDFTHTTDMSNVWEEQ